MPRTFDSASELAEALIDTVGHRIVLGLPVGVGKAVHVADALFERAAGDPDLSLTIFTGLTLESPQGGNALERRFLEPLVERVYADWPTPAYAKALRRSELPPNVEVREFYLRPGAWLANPLAQRGHTSINYTQVVAELLDLGVNVIAQLVATDGELPPRLSLGSNPDITLDLLPRFEERRRRGEAVAVVGQLNRRMPFMTGDAEVSAEHFDFILDDPALDFPLFSLPNRRVSWTDYATAMHVASLVPDGGTLQLGIGSLSDAVAHCLYLRHCVPDVFARVLARLPGGTGSRRRAALPVYLEPFDAGLFASTELLSDAMLWLHDHGIIARPADADDPAVIHAGFFLGSARFYERLSSLTDAERGRICMKSISHVNTLFGEESRKRTQRPRARFVNETMLVTLLGAAASDGLEDGRVVSGVGGQFDFVAMAHALEDACSILMCRARRVERGVARSNIRWAYGHATVPRHHRDVFVTEYGIAATRGLPDARVIDAILGIADAEFQPALVREARSAGKLDPDYAPDPESASNTPDALAAVFAPDDMRPHFPPYPLGTDLTPTEQRLVAALEWLKHRTATPAGRLGTIATALTRRSRDADRDALSRMGLWHASGTGERLLRRLVALALDRMNR